MEMLVVAWRMHLTGSVNGKGSRRFLGNLLFAHIPLALSFRLSNSCTPVMTFAAVRIELLKILQTSNIPFATVACVCPLRSAQQKFQLNDSRELFFVFTVSFKVRLCECQAVDAGLLHYFAAFMLLFDSDAVPVPLKMGQETTLLCSRMCVYYSLIISVALSTKHLSMSISESQCDSTVRSTK